jgi:hypothetical protein
MISVSKSPRICLAILKNFNLSFSVTFSQALFNSFLVIPIFNASSISLHSTETPEFYPA